jgi:hypothetical protein
MARDLLRRPPLRVSMLPPHKVSMHPGEPRMIVCPGCDRWLKPSNGGLRRHTVSIDSPLPPFGARECRQSGRRIWFDLTPAEWRAHLDVAIRDAALRRSVPVQRKAMLPVPPPVFRLAGAS